MLLIMGIWIWRNEQVLSAVQEIFARRGLLALSGMLSLMFGVAIAVGHPVWELSWRGLITLFGYLAILKGVIRIGFPEHARKYATRMIEGKGFWILWIIFFLISLYLIYCGFTQ